MRSLRSLRTHQKPFLVVQFCWSFLVSVLASQVTCQLLLLVHQPLLGSIWFWLFTAVLAQIFVNLNQGPSSAISAGIMTIWLQNAYLTKSAGAAVRKLLQRQTTRIAVTLLSAVTVAHQIMMRQTTVIVRYFTIFYKNSQVERLSEMPSQDPNIMELQQCSKQNSLSWHFGPRARPAHYCSHWDTFKSSGFKSWT